MAPHIVEVSPAGVACNPREARVEDIERFVISTTDNQPLPGDEGEGVVTPSVRQVGDGAGMARQGTREQLHVGHLISFDASHNHLP